MNSRETLKQISSKLLLIVDLILSPITLLSSFYFKGIRRAGLHRMHVSRFIFNKVGVLPIRDHYYEPFFQGGKKGISSPEERPLPGIDWNETEQLKLLNQFSYASELKDIPNYSDKPNEFFIHNGAFEGGDAEMLYSMIRYFKPDRIIEIGSGYSTLMARKAVWHNKTEDPHYHCNHSCIEPFENPWLDDLGIRIIRKPLEACDLSIFQELKENDLFFIDSSHVIRPQGDVVIEYLEILPSLNKGVIVHVHDVFSPRDYPVEWRDLELRLWDEQYLLEAFLSCQDQWKIIGAVNFLHHRHFELLSKNCPHLTRKNEPASFYIQKVS